MCTANLVQFGFFHVTDPNWTKTYEIGRKPTQFGVIRGQCIGPVKGHSLYLGRVMQKRNSQTQRGRHMSKKHTESNVRVRCDFDLRFELRN